jgi:hypothetical protein
MAPTKSHISRNGGMDVVVDLSMSDPAFKRPPAYQPYHLQGSA